MSVAFVENPWRQPPRAVEGFRRRDTEDVWRVHRQVQTYSPTPLLSVPDVARCCGIGELLVKDESFRFGLKAFKGLGGIYAMFMRICERLGLDPKTTNLEQLRQPVHQKAIRSMVFMTTSDGNHGKGVSYAAGLFGCQAIVLLPRGTVPARVDAIRKAGNGRAVLTEMNYDDCVAFSAGEAAREGYELIQDTGDDSADEMPGRIMQGYTTMVWEILDRLSVQESPMPTHVLLQAGVGAMAAAVTAALASECEHLPRIYTVESDAAACIYESMISTRGIPVCASGSGQTIMAGLNCGTPCSHAWRILREFVSGALTIGDEEAALGMRALFHARQPVVSGESGAAPVGALLALRGRDDLRARMGLDENSRVLVISTESDTDPVNYWRIIRAKGAPAPESSDA